jgi:hypothetical protein
MVSAAADQAGDEAGFFAALRAAGVEVRIRFSELRPGEVTGYSVHLPGCPDAEGTQAWYGGGRLSASLTLPQLRRRWNAARSSGTEGGGAFRGSAPGGTFRFSDPERENIYAHAARQAERAAEHIRRCAYTDPGQAADAAWAAADTLHVAARALRNPALRQAAYSYSRAARAPYGRIPAPSPEGAQLRATARLLALTGRVTGDNSLAVATPIANLAALVITIADLRAAQQHRAQAAAAHEAATHLKSCAQAPVPHHRQPRAPHPERPATVAARGHGDAPVSAPLGHPQSAAAGRHQSRRGQGPTPPSHGGPSP